MKIKISKRLFNASSKYARLIYIQIFMFCILGFLIYDLKLPRALIYLGDVINGITFITAMMVFIKNKPYIDKQIKYPMLLIGLFLIASVVSLFINQESIAQYIWGLRNNIRYVLFFFSCVVLLKKKDIENIIKVLYKLLGLNVLICSYQYFVMHGGGDYVGGLYGFVSGSNGSMNIYLIVLCTYFLIKYMERKCKIEQVAYILISSFYIAVISEIKMFFFEFAAVLTLILLLTSFKASAKKLVMVVIGVVIIYFSSSALNNTHNYSYLNNKQGFFSFSNIQEYLTRDEGYVGNGDLNRFTAIPTLSKLFFDNGIGSKSFGIGLGNADYTQAIDVFQSDFYKNYNYLHYQWFSDSFTFIETGYIGLGLYILFFVSILIRARKLKKENQEYRLYSIFTQIMIVIIFMNIVYNISLRVEYSAYLLYFILSIPYVLKKKVRENKY